MNSIVARLTFSTLLRGWRGMLLALIPLVFLCLAFLVRVIGADTEAGTAAVLSTLNFGTVIPLLALIVGTGAISTEVDDGSVVYLLTKPVRRGTIAVTKFVVACAVTLAFAVIPTFLAGVALTGAIGTEALAFTGGAVVACVAYCALFVLLGAVSRNAVVFGLIYVLLWETLVTGMVSAAGYVSVRAWAQSLAVEAGAGGEASVNAVAAGVLAVVTTVAAVWFASDRLRRFTLASQA